LKVALTDLKTQVPASMTSDGRQPPTNAYPFENAKDMRSVLEETERKQVIAALEQANWIVAGPKGAATMLGMKRSTLQSRMQKLGIRISRTHN
jgi:formate hydrogenlyase transcriptional activator